MSESFHVLVRGKRYEGTYEICGRFLVVRSAYGTRRTTIGLMEAKALAGKLLRVILRDMKTLAPSTPAIAADQAVSLGSSKLGGTVLRHGSHRVQA